MKLIILCLAFVGYAAAGGLTSITEPAVNGIVNPLGAGIGRGVYGAAAGTQQTADLLGGALEALLHTLGGVAGNVEQGAGVAVANAAPAIQSTVSAVQRNSGLVGNVVRVVASGHN